MFWEFDENPARAALRLAAVHYLSQSSKYSRSLCVWCVCLIGCEMYEIGAQNKSKCEGERWTKCAAQLEAKMDSTAFIYNTIHLYI